MPTSDFRYIIKELTPITGRGVMVVGDLITGNLMSGDSAVLHSGSSPRHIPKVSVEYMRRDGGEEVVLVLDGITADQIRVGAELRAH